MPTLLNEMKPIAYPTVDHAYDPEQLLNSLLDRMHLTEHAQLAKRLRMDKRLLNKIRERRLQISGSMLMLMQEATGITIAELRRILGDRRSTSRMACKPEQRKAHGGNIEAHNLPQGGASFRVTLPLCRGGAS